MLVTLLNAKCREYTDMRTMEANEWKHHQHSITHCGNFPSDILSNDHVLLYVYFYVKQLNWNMVEHLCIRL